MAVSETQIANEALIALGARPINDISDTTDENAIMIDAIFDALRDELLMYHEWQFAQVVVQLTEDTVVDNYTRFKHAYDLPADLLRMINLVDETHEYRDSPYRPYIIRNNHLYTDETPCWVRYTAQVTDVTQFPRWFDKSLALYIAHRIALRQSENPGKMQQMEVAYGGATAEAMRMDALSSQQFKPPSPRIDRIG